MGETPLSNELSNEVKAEMFAQESTDPFLTLVTLSNATFTLRLVNNSRDILSNGSNFTALPMKIRLPMDDGESAREFVIEFDNISLELIESLRTVTDEISVTIQLVLASAPDTIQIEHSDLIMRTITYDARKISAKIILDNFLSAEITSERYTPTNFPGLF